MRNRTALPCTSPKAANPSSSSSAVFNPSRQGDVRIPDALSTPAAGQELPAGTHDGAHLGRCVNRFSLRAGVITPAQCIVPPTAFELQRMLASFRLPCHPLRIIYVFPIRHPARPVRGLHRSNQCSASFHGYHKAIGWQDPPPRGS